MNDQVRDPKGGAMMRPGADIDRRGALRWEIAGFFFIVGLGTALHFVFDWSRGFLLLAPFAAVNESIWEHLKLAFWPALVWALCENGPLHGRISNFRLAKTAGIALMPLAITALFYAYSTVLGRNVFALAIATFVIAVAAGQYVSCRIMTADEMNPYLNRIAPGLIILLAVLFIVFTFLPPEVGLFRDSATGAFGIPG
jgi:hypothetical protein